MNFNRQEVVVACIKMFSLYCNGRELTNCEGLLPGESMFDAIYCIHYLLFNDALNCSEYHTIP